jgi:hypothetical protein
VATDRRAFFFPHPKRSGAQPGRPPFEVRATTVSATGVCPASEVVVCADGYGPNMLGSNQDPCVFSGIGPPFLSFCRIDSNGARHKVVGTKQILSHLVRPGDMVIFGKYDPPGRALRTESIWVDTVLVVDRWVRWPTSQRLQPCGANCRENKWTLASPRTLAATIAGTTDGAATDGYRFNLVDAEPGGRHCCTDLADYRVIVGRVEASSEALQQVVTSFVPLADRAIGPEGWQPVAVGKKDFTSSSEWAALCGFLDGVVRRGVGGPPQFMNKGAIAAFPDLRLALSLCRSIVNVSGRHQDRSGTVAIPPLAPVRATRQERVASATP